MNAYALRKIKSIKVLKVNMNNLNLSVYSTQSLLNARGNPHLHNSLGTYCNKTLKSIVIIITSYLIKYYSHYYKCYLISNANYTDCKYV